MNIYELWEILCNLKIGESITIPKEKVFNAARTQISLSFNHVRESDVREMLFCIEKEKRIKVYYSEIYETYTFTKYKLDEL